MDRGSRRRTSRWALGVILATCAATAIIVGLVAGNGTTPMPPVNTAALSGPTVRGFTLVYTGKPGVEVVPLDGQRPRLIRSSAAGPPVATSAGVAFVHDGTAYLLTPPYDGPPHPLVAADGLFPMAWPDMVGADRGVVGGGLTAGYLDLGATSSAFPKWQFPPGYRPIGQFFALGPGGLLRGWSPGPGDRLQLSPVIGHAAGVIGMVSSSVAWLSANACASSRECALHLTTLETPAPGLDRIVRAPRGHNGFLSGGAVDPTGAFIATFVATSPHHAALAIVTTGNLEATLVPDSTISVGHGAATAQWTPDGSYVFFSAPGDTMHAYALDSTRAVSLPLKGSSSFTIG
jgi:hypothetical protein